MTSDLAQLAGKVVRSTGARKVLEIGTGEGHVARAIAEALPPDGMLITLERDAEVASAARGTFAAGGYADKVTVMIGDALRYLHKLAGPFDLILHDGDVAQYTVVHDRLATLLAPSATLITHNLRMAGSYNDVLTADPRLDTTVLPNLGEGVAISVRRRT